MVAARQHYGAACAVVVSTGTYTPSAKELAASNAVILISNYEIPKLAELINDPALENANKTKLILPHTSLG